MSLPSLLPVPLGFLPCERPGLFAGGCVLALVARRGVADADATLSGEMPSVEGEALGVAEATATSDEDGLERFIFTIDAMVMAAMSAHAMAIDPVSAPRRRRTAVADVVRSPAVRVSAGTLDGRAAMARTSGSP